jgi:MFS family permease
MFNLPDTNNLVLTGLALSGVAQGFIFIPLLPDAIEAVYIKEKLVEGHNDYQDQLINDMASGLYGTFFSTGQILSPILGGALYDTIGFRSTTDFMALSCIGYSVIFFLFNVGFKIFSQEKKIREKMEALE